MGGGDDQWVTGAVGPPGAHWKESDFLAYRAIVTKLNENAEYISFFQFDTAKSADKKHAIDYLSSFNYTETNSPTPSNTNANGIDVCNDLFTCDINQPNQTIAIPIPDALTYNYHTLFPTCAQGHFEGTPTDGELYAWIDKGSITVNSINFEQVGPTPAHIVDDTLGPCPVKFNINYTLTGISSAKNNESTVVFAWGGHVSSNADVGDGVWLNDISDPFNVLMAHVPFLVENHIT